MTFHRRPRDSGHERHIVFASGAVYAAVVVLEVLVAVLVVALAGR